MVKIITKNDEKNNNREGLRELRMKVYVPNMPT